MAQVSEPPIDRMVALNKRAFADILSQHFQAARYWLEEALVIGETAGLENDEITARTYIHLAAVALAGLKDRDEALRFLGLALKINPNVAITRGLELQGFKSAYLQAREQAGLPPNPDPTAPSFDTFAADAPEATSAAEGPPRSVDRESDSPASPPEIPQDLTNPVRPAYAAALVNEPDPPARVPAPLYCPMPLEILPGHDLVVRCLIQRYAHRSSAVFHHRAGVNGGYLDLPMDRSPKGWLVAVVPGQSIAGDSLGYYVTAELPGSQQALHVGYPESPRSLVVRTVSSDVADGSTSSAAEVPQAETGPARRRGPGSIWFAVAGGSGFVYHGRETVDSNSRGRDSATPVEVEEGFSPAWLFQVEPEVGYQATARLSFSLMARYQYAPKDGDDSSTPKEVLTSAFAVYLQTKFSFLTVGKLQAYAAGGAGVGRSFLAVVGQDCGKNDCTLNHSDTLHGGGAGLLAGVGAIYHLSPNLGIFAELKELATLPKFMALTELGLGVALAAEVGRPRSERLASSGEDGYLP